MSRLFNFIKKASVVCLVGALSLGMTGCTNPFSNSDSESDSVNPQHVAIVVSNTMNEGTVDTSSLSMDITDVSLVAGSTVSIFNCDGDSQYVDTFTIPKYKSGISKSKKIQLAEGYALQIIDVLTNLIPQNDELDVFQAIAMAARQLSEYKGEKTLYIASSGLSTQGLVDFTNLYLEDDHSKEVCEVLKDEMPDLTGVKVVWFGIGEVSGVQTNLYESNRKILINTWKNLLVSAGVDENNISFSSALAVNKEDKSSDIPNVSVVPISQPGSLLADGDFQVEGESKTGQKETKVLNLKENVTFKADSTELKNRNKAKNSLSKIVDYLKKDASREILLVGTTSSAGKKNSLEKFSLKRCQTIRELLTSQGVKQSQILCVGAGYGSSLTVADRDDAGSLIEKLADKNRSVFLFTNAESKIAQQFIKTYKVQ